MVSDSISSLVKSVKVSNIISPDIVMHDHIQKVYVEVSGFRLLNIVQRFHLLSCF